ncbi:MAG: transporter [Rhodospirillales bacterium]|nr:transporter [Rhodospirillales bacterium]
MSNFLPQDQWYSKWLVFGAVSFAFFFLNLATFTSLGVVLYSMVAELHWSFTAAGFSFSFLGLACGMSSPLPALTMRLYGGRFTVCVGAGFLMLAFFLSSISHSLLMFYIAMTFLGIGYSFAGNVPAVYLISGWFGRGSARIIGLYLMLGALGGAFGPPIVRAIVNSTGGWRGHWQAMAITAAVVGIVCFVLVRDAKVKSATDLAGPHDVSAATGKGGIASSSEWNPKQAVFTPQFLLIAGAMTATMFCVTTNSSVAVNHLVNLGATPDGAAFVLSAISITATAVKAFAGWMCEKISPPHIAAAGLILQAIGTCMLGFADSTTLQYSSAIIFGMGWGLTYVAGTVVLLDYFGGPVGSRILSIVWLLVSVAAAGPAAAGMIADRYGTFSPIFVVYAVMLTALSIPIFLMRRPVLKAAGLHNTVSHDPGMPRKIEAT